MFKKKNAGKGGVLASPYYIYPPYATPYICQEQPAFRIYSYSVPTATRAVSSPLFFNNGGTRVTITGHLFLCKGFSKASNSRLRLSRLLTIGKSHCSLFPFANQLLTCLHRPGFKDKSKTRSEAVPAPIWPRILPAPSFKIKTTPPAFKLRLNCSSGSYYSIFASA